MTNNKHTFRAIIENAGNGGAFVSVPFDVEKVFSKKRVKVKATIDGVLYQGSLVRMGGACHVLGILKEIREKIGKSFGEEIEVVLEEDTEPRIVTIPHDLQKGLESHPEALAFFNQLSYSHQKEYVQWIEDAKRDQTRLGRINQVVELLSHGKKSRE